MLKSGKPDVITLAYEFESNFDFRNPGATSSDLLTNPNGIYRKLSAEDLRELLNNITDDFLKAVLVSHSPRYGYLDEYTFLFSLSGFDLSFGASRILSMPGTRSRLPNNSFVYMAGQP